jgi:RNA polymerase sigma factor (sigma-70 family)
VSGGGAQSRAQRWPGVERHGTKGAPLVEPRDVPGRAAPANGSDCADIAPLIERSSLGEPAVKQLRSHTPARLADAVVELAAEQARISHGLSTYKAPNNTAKPEPGGHCTVPSRRRGVPASPAGAGAAKESEMFEGQAVSDLVLLDAWHRGDQAAVTELFERHYKGVARFFYNKVSEPVQDDLIHETFLACLIGATRFRGQASFKTFLYAIARNVLVDHLRQSVRRRACLDSHIDVDDVDETPIPSSELSPVATAVQHEEQQLLLKALRRIPLIHQVVLELYFWEDLTTAEIGDVLGVPVGTVKTRLRDGRIHFREHYVELRRASEAPRDTVAGRDDAEPDDLAAWARRIRAHASPRAEPDVSEAVRAVTGVWRTAR